MRNFWIVRQRKRDLAFWDSRINEIFVFRYYFNISPEDVSQIPEHERKRIVQARMAGIHTGEVKLEELLDCPPTKKGSGEQNCRNQQDNAKRNNL